MYGTAARVGLGMYGTGARRFGLGAITAPQTMLGPQNSDFAITGIEPATPFAGPGTQRIVIHGVNLGGHQALSVGAWGDGGSSSGGTLENISADGTRGEVTLDFKGEAGRWQLQVFDPYKSGNLESNPIVFTVAAGTPVAYDPNSFAVMFQQGLINPYVAQAVLEYDSKGNVVVKGGVAYPPGADGVVRRIDTSGPGLLYDRPGGRWEFVPVQNFTDADRQAAADVYQIPNNVTAWANRGGLDPFGIPLPGTIGRGDGQVPWVWPSGAAVVSPWAASYVASGGGSAGSAGGSGGAVQPVLYASPLAPPVAPGNTPTPPAATTSPVQPLYTSTTTVSPGPIAPAAGPSTSITPPLYQSPMANGPDVNVNVQPAAAPTTDGAGWLTAIAAVIGAAGAYHVYKNSKRRRSW